MTYLIGFSQPNINAIISDTRMSRMGVDGVWFGENNALKTGLLFPGCIYGITGNSYWANEFIISFKNSIGDQRDENVLWERFLDVVNSYSFLQGEGNKFQLLLSSRSTSTPCFYVLDSSSGISIVEKNNDYEILSFGSGKPILDNFVGAKSSKTLKGLQKYLANERNLPQEFVHEISPYFLCLWLSELSLSSEKQLFENYLVGGPFHFVYQTTSHELPQKPAIYILSGANKRTKNIYSWWYRITYAYGGLFIESISPPNNNEPGNKQIFEEFLLFSTSGTPGVQYLDRDTLYKKVKQDLETQPFWYFCGLGYTSRDDRECHFFNVSINGKKEDIFNESGSLRPEITELIESGYTGEILPDVPNLQFD